MSEHRMFTPDWEDVLNFHIICCCMIRPVSQYGKCYLFPIKGTGRMVYFPILYIDRHKARSARKHKYPLLDGRRGEQHKWTTSNINPISITFILRHFMSLTASISHFPSSSILDRSSQQIRRWREPYTPYEVLVQGVAYCWGTEGRVWVPPECFTCSS